MSLNRADIENIARLARLELTETEIPVYVDSLSRIFAFVGELDRAPTAGIAPMAHPCRGWRSGCDRTRSPRATTASSISATRRRWKRASTSCPR